MVSVLTDSTYSCPPDIFHSYPKMNGFSPSFENEHACQEDTWLRKCQWGDFLGAESLRRHFPLLTSAFSYIEALSFMSAFWEDRVIQGQIWGGKISADGGWWSDMNCVIAVAWFLSGHDVTKLSMCPHLLRRAPVSLELGVLSKTWLLLSQFLSPQFLPPLLIPFPGTTLFYSWTPSFIYLFIPQIFVNCLP